MATKETEPKPEKNQLQEQLDSFKSVFGDDVDRVLVLLQINQLVVLNNLVAQVVQQQTSKFEPQILNIRGK